MGGLGTTVLCVDHDARVVDRLTWAVEREPDLRLAGCLLGARTIAATIEARRPDVAVVNVDDPDVTEDEVLGQVRQAAARTPQTRVIVTTSKSNPLLRAKAAAHGAIGFVHKDAGQALLLEAIRTVALGRYALLSAPDSPQWCAL